MALADGQKVTRRSTEALRDFEAAVAHDQAGRRDRAEALYRKVLQRVPDHADALHLLGVIANKRGRHQRAIQLIERALASVPDFPTAHLNLGIALQAAGRRADAAESYQRAIALRPDYAIAHCNLAAIQNEQGAFEAGLASAQRAVDLMPDLAPAHINRADALVGQHRFDEAAASLRAALTLLPERPETHSHLGLVLTELDRFDEATACHQEAIALPPGDALMHAALGRTLFQAAELKASETSYRQALALAPNQAKIWHWLGHTLLARGRTEEAVSCFRRALEIDPDLAEADECLARSGSVAENEGRLRRLAGVLATSDRSMMERVSAGFALGTYLDNAARPDEAFPYFREANVLCRQLLIDTGEWFDADVLRREVSGVIERCSSALFVAAAGWGNPSELPVFIVGMPRSGTSLVEQIVASHSQVFGAGERREISRIAERVLEHNRDRPVECWDMDFARRHADEFMAHLRNFGGGAVRVTDKMPDNVLHLGIIAVLFPSARVVFCRRDARDTCLSCFFHREGNAFSYDLVDCGQRYLEIERLAAHWRSVLPLSMLTVDYEDLIGDPEGESRRLIEFLGLDWEPRCLDFQYTERPVFTGSSWQVRKPIFSRSVGRWRRYEQHLQPLLGILEGDEQS
jgi:tetratricopeptide (TPR) repeat protein